MNVLTLLAQAPDPQANTSYGFAFFAVLCIAGLTLWKRGAGIGCLGFAIFFFVMGTVGERAVGWDAALRSIMIVVVAFVAVDANRRFKANRAREEEAAADREHEDAVRTQRAAIPTSARSLGFVYYEGGIPAMDPGEEVELLVAGTTLWLAPVYPDVPAVPLDCTRLVELYVVEGTANVVLALEGKRGRNQEVELSATADDLIETGRQLYAILDDALPAHGPPGSSPAALPAAARRICGGCGAPAPGERCTYCGRPA
jgi:hypothetical protein